MLIIGGSSPQPRLLPAGVQLYRLQADGCMHLIDRHGVRRVHPAVERTERASSGGHVAAAGEMINFLRFVDDGQLAHYLVGHAGTSPAAPTNATYKLGVIRPRSAFTPHAHAGEHFVLSLGYASCDVFDEEQERVVVVPLTPGTMIRIPEMAPHAFANRAGTPLLILVANTGYGIDHTDYAVTAAEAERRAAGMAGVTGRRPLAQGRPGRAGQPGSVEHPGVEWHRGAGAGVDYRRLAAALRALENAGQPATLRGAERIASVLRAVASRLEYLR